MELEGALLPHVLDDPKVTVAVISTTQINQTGLSPTKDGIFIADKDSPHTKSRCATLLDDRRGDRRTVPFGSAGVIVPPVGYLQRLREIWYPA